MERGLRGCTDESWSLDVCYDGDGLVRGVFHCGLELGRGGTAVVAGKEGRRNLCRSLLLYRFGDGEGHCRWHRYSLAVLGTFVQMSLW